MSRWGCLLLIVVAGAQMGEHESGSPARVWAQTDSGSSPTPSAIPTVTIYESTPVSVPTVTIPRPTSTPRPTATPKPKPVKHKKQPAKKKSPAKVTRPSGAWITAYLTSYCPGSAGWVSASGTVVHYGTLANDFYPFGTHVYIPVLGMTGVVEDHFGGGAAWNQFDVWSPTCYGTPTGYFRVSILGR